VDTSRVAAPFPVSRPARPADHRRREARADPGAGDSAGLEGRLDLVPGEGKLLATGLDAAGRRQYLYHEDYRAAQEEAKFGKLVRFADALPVLREAMSERMELEPMSPEWTCALAVGLINLRWFRVGDDRYTKAHRTFGITTLRKSHVKVRGSRIAFRFRAKHRIWVRTAVVDSELAEAIRELLDTPGQRLFRYRLEARNSRRRISGRGAAR
jgi:DNA topoisomerase-1